VSRTRQPVQLDIGILLYVARRVGGFLDMGAYGLDWQDLTARGYGKVRQPGFASSFFLPPGSLHFVQVSNRVTNQCSSRPGNHRTLQGFTAHLQSRRKAFITHESQGFSRTSTTTVILFLSFNINPYPSTSATTTTALHLPSFPLFKRRRTRSWGSKRTHRMPGEQGRELGEPES